MDHMTTEEILAKAFISLPDKKSMDKISVSDIAAACNASRQTFYNHFQDKDALMLWIVGEDIRKAGVDLSLPVSFRTYVVRHLSGMQQHQVFYTKMLKSVSYEAFHQSAKSNMITTITQWIETVQKKPITPEQTFCLSLFCHGYMFAIREWFLHGQGLSIDKLADCTLRSVPEPLKPFLL